MYNVCYQCISDFIILSSLDIFRYFETILSQGNQLSATVFFKKIIDLMRSSVKNYQSINNNVFMACGEIMLRDKILLIIQLIDLWLSIIFTSN